MSDRRKVSPDEFPTKSLVRLKKDAWTFNFQASFVIFNMNKTNMIWIN